ncbi:hypothetical protein QUB75_28995 [Microcoleus sp. K1-B6]
MLYPSRQNLRDHNGNSRQAIAFKHIRPLAKVLFINLLNGPQSPS